MTNKGVGNHIPIYKAIKWLEWLALVYIHALATIYPRSSTQLSRNTVKTLTSFTERVKSVNYSFANFIESLQAQLSIYCA